MNSRTILPGLMGLLVLAGCSGPAKDRPRFRAFTLVELLVVILIICLLLALLMPAFASAWQMAEMTQCKTNLATLYKAQGVWAADRENPSTSLAAGWAGSILPYLENRPSSLKCPSCPKVGSGVSLGEEGGPLPTENDPYGEGTFPGSTIEMKDVAIGVLTADGALLYEIPLAASSYWSGFGYWPANVKLNAGGEPTEPSLGTVPNPSMGSVMVGANMDGAYAFPWPDGSYDTDYFFEVTYRNGKPYEVTILTCDGSAGTDINGNRCLADFRVNHKPIWNGQQFSNLFGAGHVGETINLYEEAVKNGTLKPNLYAWTAWFTSTGVLGATNYGISRGACLDKAARIVPIPDPKLFFILDYPRTIADYTEINDGGRDTDYWTQIFISPAPPEGWTPPKGLESYTWQEVQALRHFGKANVLFCDGHIESLGQNDLNPLDPLITPLWRYGAR